jgi:hypothetical protein
MATKAPEPGEPPFPAYVWDVLATGWAGLTKAFMCIKGHRLRRRIVNLVEGNRPRKRTSTDDFPAAKPVRLLTAFRHAATNPTARIGHSCKELCPGVPNELPFYQRVGFRRPPR